MPRGPGRPSVAFDATMSELGLALLLVFAVNVMPAFMPPTWMILAFAHLTLGASVLPLAVGGAFAAAGGRVTLALAARRWGTLLLSAERRASLTELGLWLERRAGWAVPAAVLIYSFGPIPSNQLFVAAGLTRMGLGRIASAFLTGRLISYPLWIGAARIAVDRIDELFAQRWLNVTALGVDVALIGVLIAFTRVDWMRVIETFDSRRAAARRRGSPP
ncbi:MAG: hypothetical protein Q7S41_03465 [Candidatus Limnocylindria bacterium]|nr:hypothetical protein [Candidatus Limnocylindria bacterium]